MSINFYIKEIFGRSKRSCYCLTLKEYISRLFRKGLKSAKADLSI